MSIKNISRDKQSGGKIDKEKIRNVVAEARKTLGRQEQTYRERSLQIHPWICARCGREFTNKNLHLLTVHHKDHNHDNNPSDGNNWENLCIYCHENEHRRYLDHLESDGAEVGDEKDETLTHNPFGNLKGLLDN